MAKNPILYTAFVSPETDTVLRSLALRLNLAKGDLIRQILEDYASNQKAVLVPKTPKASDALFVEITGKEMTALCILVRHQSKKTSLKDFNSIVKTLNGDALAIAQLMYGRKPKTAKDKELLKHVKRLKDWAKQLPKAKG